MSIRPIDLQVLFGKLAQVGKEQNIQKEAAVLNQHIQGQELTKEATHNDQSVNKANQTAEDVKVKEEKEEAGEGSASSTNQKEAGEEQNENPETFSDPDLGHNIDVSG